MGTFLSGSTGVRSASEDLAFHLGAAGYRVLTSSGWRSRPLRLLDMIRTTLWKRGQYDVAHIDVFSGAAFRYAEIVGGVLRLLRKPYILTLHGGNLPGYGRRWPRRMRRLLGTAAAVIAPSPYLVSHMQQYRADILSLPNGIVAGDYAFRLRERPQPTLLWLRAFHRTYNPRLAPEVVGRLAAAFPGIRLTMVGRDKGDGSLQETARAASAVGVLDRLQFPGGVPKADIPRWLEHADIFLNTPDIDNAPVSLVEAMAAGLCIVSTRVGGIPYLLEDGRDALLVPPGDPEAMAQAVRRVLNEPGLAARLSANARAKAERFDWSVILPRWEELLGAVFARVRHE